MAASPLPSRGPTNGQKCYVTPASTGVPNTKRKEKINLTPTFSEAHKWAELLRNTCILGGQQRQARGTKSEVAASPLPSQGLKRERNC